MQSKITSVVELNNKNEKWFNSIKNYTCPECNTKLNMEERQTCIHVQGNNEKVVGLFYSEIGTCPCCETEYDYGDTQYKEKENK